MELLATSAQPFIIKSLFKCGCKWQNVSSGALCGNIIYLIKGPKSWLPAWLDPGTGVSPALISPSLGLPSATLPLASGPFETPQTEVRVQLKECASPWLLREILRPTFTGWNWIQGAEVHPVTALGPCIYHDFTWKRWVHCSIGQTCATVSIPRLVLEPHPHCSREAQDTSLLPQSKITSNLIKGKGYPPVKNSQSAYKSMRLKPILWLIWLKMSSHYCIVTNSMGVYIWRSVRKYYFKNYFLKKY